MLNHFTHLRINKAELVGVKMRNSIFDTYNNNICTSTKMLGVISKITILLSKVDFKTT